MDINQNTKKTQTEDFLKIQDIFYICVGRWYWFAATLFVTVGIATFYLLSTPPIYTRSASVMIKDDRKSSSSFGGVEQSFSNMGLFK